LPFVTKLKLLGEIHVLERARTLMQSLRSIRIADKTACPAVHNSYPVSFSDN
jgi:hypothetical protein